jgi:hypothetical protein
LAWSRWPLHTRDRSPILENDPDREIVAINIERDLDVLGVQIWTGWIVKSPDFAACRDQATNGVCIARSVFEAVPKMDRAEFILVRSVDAIVAHRNEGDLIRPVRDVRRTLRMRTL